jgi:thioredoxin 1
MAKFGDLIQSKKPVLIDFSAEWCGPCKMMAPILHDLKNKVGDHATILKIDVDKNPEIAAQYGIQSVPTLMIFKEGQLKWRQSGVVSATDLQSLLNKEAAVG